MPENLLAENPDEVHEGGANLRKQIENVRIHGVSPVVAINRFPEDHDTDLTAIAEIAEECGARCAITNHFSEGGVGASELAEAVAEATEEKTNFSVLYPDEMNIKEKIKTVATKVYGAEDVEFSPTATKQIDSYTGNGFGNLPVCIAKTHLSVSSDASLKGAHTGWTLPVREVRASIGAGFVYPICGEMRTMPGLGKTPAAASIDIDENGEIVGLS